MQRITKITMALVVFPTSLGLSSCSRQPSSETESIINQSEICQVNDWHRDVTAAACKPGQKVLFLPDVWGNDQLPIVFAGVNCDLRYSVAMNNGGVTCIYAPFTPKEKKEETPSKP